MKDGIVKWFDDKKGFGFINCEGKEYFAHFKSIQADGHKTLKEGQKVTFTVGKGLKGPLAENIKIVA
jgi:CspA family cold shock protein